jgi:multiple sugar transport system permease protein
MVVVTSYRSLDGREAASPGLPNRGGESRWAADGLAAKPGRVERQSPRINWWRLQRKYEGYLFLAPNIIGFLAFMAFPVVAALALSLFRWELLVPPVFVGLGNFKRLLTSDMQFRQVAFNTIYFTFGTVPLRVVLSLLLALALNRAVRGVTLYRTLFFMPVVSSLIAVALIWKFMLNSNFGIINSVIFWVGHQLGVTVNPPAWLSSTTWAMPAVIGLNLWKNVGLTMIIYLAGLQAIPQELYEAAEVDGGSAWAKFWHITIPMVSPTTFFVMVMSFIWAFQMFEEAFILTEGGPGFSTTTIVYYIYIMAFTAYQMGYAAAIALVLFAIIFAITLVQVFSQGRWVYYETGRE